MNSELQSFYYKTLGELLTAKDKEPSPGMQKLIIAAYDAIETLYTIEKERNSYYNFNQKPPKSEKESK